MIFNTVSVVGLGYIGLPTAAVFASRGVEVIGVDVSQTVVDTINQGEIHIEEPHLDMLVKATVTEGTLSAYLTPQPADAFVIAVPTPFKGENYEPDLSYIESAAQAIAPVLKKGNLVVLESTSPVGATEQMMRTLSNARPDLTFPDSLGVESDIRVAHCPERVLPGHVIRELVENDRIIGGITSACSEAAAALYGVFLEGECHFTDARTAEMTKLAENSFRDVNIAFANELSMISDQVGVEVRELLRMANYHPRVNILSPGAGVGGHCIAVDPWFLISASPEKAKLIHAARRVNLNKPRWVVERVLEATTEWQAEYKKVPRVVCFGLSFKPDIDDFRESPALEIVNDLALHSSHLSLHVHDPWQENLKLNCHAKKVTLKEALALSDISVILVGHSDYQEIDFSCSKIIDVCGITS